MAHANHRYEPLPDVVCTHLDDGESVLLHLITRQYYTLNDTGSHVWRCVDEGRSVEEIVGEFMEHYAVEAADVRDFIVSYLVELEAEGLIMASS